MSRRLLTFPCEGDTLVGTLDGPPEGGGGATGLLIVTGGNEIRAGAHRGMAELAARLAADGTPVFRYDRRGVGDASGINSGFRGARDDLLAAAATFRAVAPRVTLRPDEKAQRWLLAISASDRAGLLYLVARILAQHHLSVQLAKVSTLGERVEDTLLIQGPELQNNARQIEIETELLDALAN